MLRVRPEQLEVFARAKRAEFVAVVAAIARKHWPGRCAAIGAGLEAEVARTMATARELGITAKSDLIRFVNLRLALGPEMHRLPWVAEILAQTQMHPAMKVEALVDRAREVLHEL
jgi:hypothetical protein